MTAIRAVVTGGAGFLGSHLCRKLLTQNLDVLCIDSFITGHPENVADLVGTDGFTLQRQDVTKPLGVKGPVDWVFHLASPASPPAYLTYPIHTLKVGAFGTLHALELARRRGAGLVLASTSEVYGDPKVRPQPESYWGNVNPVGPRSVYDEAKRYAEALTMAYHRTHQIPIRIARIFNTYGPHMGREDGRAVPTFVKQALAGEPLSVHGSGSQTRSLCYVDDLIDGIWRLSMSDVTGPVNLGNPEEVTVLHLARLIRKLAGSRSDITFTPRPVDDPEVRCPDITQARERLGWEPSVSLAEGITRTLAWAAGSWSGDSAARQAAIP